MGDWSEISQHQVAMTVPGPRLSVPRSNDFLREARNPELRTCTPKHWQEIQNH